MGATLTGAGMDASLARVPPRTLAIALGSLLVLGLLAGYLYVLKKPMTELERLSRAEREAAAEVAAERAATDEAEIARLSAEVDRLHAALHGSHAELPDNQLVAHVIGALDRLAAAHGVQLVSVKPGTTTRVLMFKEVPFDVEASGDYFALHDWLDGAARELAPMVVKQFQLQSPGAGAPLRMSLRLVSYRFEGEP